MNNNKKSKKFVIAGCLAAVGIIMLIISANMANDWRYYLSQEYNSTVNTVKYCGWGALVAAVIPLLSGSGKNSQGTSQKIENPKSIYAEGMYYMGEAKTYDNIGAAYRCFIKIPDYEDAKWKAMECRRMLEAMDAEKEQV